MSIQQYPTPSVGIPSGDTAGRPAAPSLGDTYYNGELGYLEIYDGTNWIPSSAAPSQPTMSIADVGTGAAYGAAQAVATFTPGTSAGITYGYVVDSTTGGYTATSASTAITITVGNNGNYSFTGYAYNFFGQSVITPITNATLTTVPQAPTIGTATTSSTTTDAVVNWTLNSNGGKNLTSISVIPYIGSTAQTPVTAATTTSTSATISGLTAGQAYTFKVKATNANGDSLESSNSNSVTIPIIFTVDYLVIAGGGGGGGTSSGGLAGGGGAGGYRTSAGTSGANSAAESSLSLITSTNYTTTVGAGGSGVSGANGNIGNNSVFNTITSTAGGGGGYAYNLGANGGSGGGSGGGGAFGNNQVSPGGNGTANQGSNGKGGVTGPGKSGGGGGASAIGGNPNGGAGLDSSITGTSVTRAGGGGGGGSPVGTGGTGGGGDGGNGANGSAGSANTGGGGGGSSGGTYAGGNGGSGVVILRYPDTRTITIGAGLTGTESAASGGFKRATITAGTGNVSWS